MLNTLITTFCIIGISIYFYAYMMNIHVNKKISTKCNVLYIPRNDNPFEHLSTHSEIIGLEKLNSFIMPNFDHPKGVSSIDDLIPTLNNN